MTVIPLPKVAEELGPYTASGSITTAMLHRARRDGVITFGPGGMDRSELDRIRRERVCGLDGCSNVTFGKTGYCQPHRGKANAGKKVAEGTRGKQDGYRLSEAGLERKREVLKATREEVLADPERREAWIERRQATRRRMIDTAKAEAGEPVLETGEFAERLKADERLLLGRSEGTVNEHAAEGLIERADRDPKVPGRQPNLFTESGYEDYVDLLVSHPDGRRRRFDEFNEYRTIDAAVSRMAVKRALDQARPA